MHREVIRLAVFLRGCRSIATTFNALHGQRATVGHDFVAKVLRAHADEIAARRRGMRGAVPRAHRVGEAIAMDLTSVQGFHVLGIIDRGSRRMLRLRALAHKGTWSLLGHLCLAIAEHGRPATLRTDNESMFISRLWRTALRRMGIRHQRTQVASPWQNGCIERFWGSLKPVLGRLSLNSIEILQGALDEFACFYNHVRPHQALGGLTPVQVWHGVVIDDVRRCAGCGRWVQACDGQLIGYHLRH